MNCKQGDLAVLIRVVSPHCNPNLGRFFEVLRPTVLDGEPAWTIRIVGTPGVNDQGHELREGKARDRSLRPIRDPGDDAQDETLSWLPAPHKEHA